MPHKYPIALPTCSVGHGAIVEATQAPRPRPATRHGGQVGLLARCDQAHVEAAQG
ncbi:hypothetical protein Pla175_23830 [Pirellulimonas nuda]|uniref:Uncharacterized protein n=1 Tax=Pirellulimonas nuda TaxID=2528009 RepID=A0A518DC02_9BACT|nr:hypothetical protein Pla175_23830 [Pirellulimonas nuda]